MRPPLYQQIHDLVRQIPTGHVTTYGQLARMVDCNARTVGFAMAALANNTDVPWHRVINSQGRISRRADGDRDLLQRDLLITEGIVFDRTGRIDLERFHWSLPLTD